MFREFPAALHRSHCDIGFPGQVAQEVLACRKDIDPEGDGHGEEHRRGRKNAQDDERNERRNGFRPREG